MLKLNHFFILYFFFDNNNCFSELLTTRVFIFTFEELFYNIVYYEHSDKRVLHFLINGYISGVAARTSGIRLNIC